MEDAGNILLFWFDPSIRWILQEILPLEGYAVMATHDPAELLRVIEQSAEPCLILTDNLKVNPAGVEALRRLRANPELGKRVRVIGFDIDSVRELELSWGILDDFVAMGVRDLTLPDTIEAHMDALASQ